MNASRWVVVTVAVGLVGPMLSAGCFESRNRSIALMNQGVEMGKQKLYDSAVRNLKLACETDPTNHLAWYNLGIVYKDQKKWEDAAGAFQQAVKLQDASSAYHYELGNAYQEAGLEAKKPDPKKAATMTAADTERLAATAAPKFDQAKAEFEASLRIQPSYKAHFRLGRLLESQEKFREADSEYRKAIELNPRFPESFVRLGNLYLDHDYDNEALRVFQEGVKANETNGEVHLGLGEALQKTKQYAEAVNEFKKALGHNGDLFIAVYDIGIAYKMLDDKKHAREWLQRFITNAGTKGSPELMKAASDAMYQLDAP